MYVWVGRAEQYNIEVVKHPHGVPMPDMTQLETAFQLYLPADQSYQSELRFSKPVYLARHNPYMLARAIMDAGRQVHAAKPQCSAASHRLTASAALARFRIANRHALAFRSAGQSAQD